MTAALPSAHPTLPPARTGVLLINLGTPDGTDYRSVRRYLKEFLSDRRVIEVPPLIWQPILHLFILTRRPFASGAAYAKIWDRERDESPLRTITRAQADALATRLGATWPDLRVDWAMRYGQPAIADRLAALKDQGCDRILLFALYPQYSASTTATAYDQAFRALMRLRWQPAVRTAPPYHDDPGYIAALAASVREQIAAQGWTPDRLIASFHGLPQQYFDAGDPYHCHCQKTGRLLREALGWAEDAFEVTFQSRFGPREWLRPYTDKTLEALPAQGARKVTVITPGFAADCIETLEEIAMAGKEQFEAAGGSHYSMVPCLNDRDDHLAALSTLIETELAGWLDRDG